MLQKNRTRVSATLCLAIVAAAGCGSSQPASAPAPVAASAPAPVAGTLDIGFRSQPDPPVMGENSFEVTVAQADGTPVEDAEVTVELFMAAMPEMNMGEMRNSLPLLHQSAGTYSGGGQVMMSGNWDLTVTVTRGGALLGSRVFPLAAQ